MSKGKYHEWVTPEGISMLEGWARDGMLDVDIAAKMGIAPGTLYEWKNRFPEMAEALKKGKEVVDIQVENALLKKALSGDVTAIIFWLKNRQPSKWRDKQNVDVDKSVTFVFDQVDDEGDIFG